MKLKDRIAQLELENEELKKSVESLATYSSYLNNICVSSLAAMNRAFITISKDAIDKFLEKGLVATYKFDDVGNMIAFTQKLTLNNPIEKGDNQDYD